MGNEIEITQNKLNHVLDGALSNASSIITKDYLDRIETLDIVKPSTEDIDINIATCGKFYKLTKLVVNREENFLNKLTTIVNVASSIRCSIATIISSDGYHIDYYFGIVSKNERMEQETSKKRREANSAAFRGALIGNLVGSELEEVSEDQVEYFKNNVLAKKGKCYSSVSGIVALRDDEDKTVEGYVQGIENLVDSLKEQKYSIVMLADPIDTSKIQVIKNGYELLHTQLSTFARSNVTINESDTLSLSKSKTDGISDGISKGIAMTQSKTNTKGKYFGGSVGVGVNFVVSANVGIHAGVNNSTAYTTGKTDTTMETQQRNKSVTDTTSSAKTAGKSLQLSYENRSVKTLLDKIDRHLIRLDECESFGAFDCAAYVIADDRETVLTVASNYNALMRGKNSSIQASHINSWYKEEDTKEIGKYLGSLVHPRFWQNRSDGIIVTPSSIISGDELAIQVGLPKKSISGVTVVPMAPFGRNVINKGGRSIELGNLYHMGHDEGQKNHEQKVQIDIESLAMHTFITGSTGSGKSTAIYAILEKLMTNKVEGKDENISFLVIEPAKGEYKDRFGGYSNVQVYGTNYKKTPLLKIDPFSFPEDIHVLEHIDRLIEIFNICWPMYAAMPAVLKDAVERAYIVSGWNLDRSENKYRDSKGRPLFPSFVDVLNQINHVMEETAYSSDSKGDYKGALCTRLKSLTNGLYGQILTNDEISSEDLFDRNIIVDLSRIGSSETKSLIMGLLVMKLQEHRMSNSCGGNESLKHVTVLEEAHNILKRTSTQQSNEGSNIFGKSVEMLSNSIAEMRTYGEGFIIADQAPGLMDMSVIRNTNTKIILRLPSLEDRELVGRAASLNEDQILELSRLKTFVAAVYQNNWLEPVLCSIESNFKKLPVFRYESKVEKNVDRTRCIKYLLLPIDKKKKIDNKYIDELISDIYGLPIPAESKVAFVKYISATEKEEIQRYRGQVVYSLFNSETAFGFVKTKSSNIESWYSHFKEVLEPNITMLCEEDQRKIVAMIAREKAQIDGSKNSTELFERLMDFM